MYDYVTHSYRIERNATKEEIVSTARRKRCYQTNASLTTSIKYKSFIVIQLNLNALTVSVLPDIKRPTCRYVRVNFRSPEFSIRTEIGISRGRDCWLIHLTYFLKRDSYLHYCN